MEEIEFIAERPVERTMEKMEDTENAEPLSVFLHEVMSFEYFLRVCSFSAHWMGHFWLFLVSYKFSVTTVMLDEWTYTPTLSNTPTKLMVSNLSY